MTRTPYEKRDHDALPGMRDPVGWKTDCDLIFSVAFRVIKFETTDEGLTDNMNSKNTELTLVDGDQATLRRKVVQDLLHFRSNEARATLDTLSRRAVLRSVNEPDAYDEMQQLPRAR